jgi:hypothetical protein
LYQLASARGTAAGQRSGAGDTMPVATFAAKATNAISLLAELPVLLMMRALA